MSGIHKTCAHIGGNLDYLIIPGRPEKGKAFISIINIVNRFKHCPPGPAIFAVLSFNLHFLNVPAIRQQNLTKFNGCRGGVYFTFKTVLNQFRNQTTVIDVGMGKQNTLYASGRY
ncbi:MAG: hypothetical protein BWY80_01042 [Firmicutes bacterium ADurb.Bin456]|nr:MAG: hypothetical protein BWY80_01042 [Firmicutes bacterium ADurb.Bin456]